MVGFLFFLHWFVACAELELLNPRQILKSDLLHGQDEINISGKLHFPGLNRVFIVVYIYMYI